MASTLVVADLSSVAPGAKGFVDYNPIGYAFSFGSLSPALLPPYANIGFVTGDGADITVIIEGNRVAALANLTHLKIDGTILEVTVAPWWDSGLGPSGVTNIDFESYAVTIGNSYEVEFLFKETFNQTVTDTNNDGRYHPTFSATSMDMYSYGGIRFTNVDIPADSLILSATLSIHGYLEWSSSTGETIKGVLGDAPALSAIDPATVGKTTATTTLVFNDTAFQHHDVAAIVQEIVNGTWSSGNDLAFILAIASGNIQFYDVTDESNASYITIEYVPTGAPAPEPPNITTSTSFNNPDGQTLSIALTADKTISSWAEVGGTDQDDFEISGTTLRWNSNGVKSYASPTDSDSNNTYVVTVRATDTDGLTDDITITVTVVEIPDPVITSTATISIFEGQILEHQITADKTISSLSINGGADSAWFMADGDNKLRWFNDIPKSYSDPDDAGANNVYNVQILIEDTDGKTATQDITVTVQSAPFVVTLRNPGSGFNVFLNEVETPTEVFAAASVTESADTLSASTKIKVTAALASAEISDTLVAPTKVKVKAQVSSTEGSDTVSSPAKVKAKATCAISENFDTISTASKVNLRAVVAANEDSDTVISEADLPLGSLLAEISISEGDDALASGTKLVISAHNLVPGSVSAISAWKSPTLSQPGDVFAGPGYWESWANNQGDSASLTLGVAGITDEQMVDNHIDSTHPSQLLSLKNFDFGVPTDATISGIELEVRFIASDAGVYFDEFVYIADAENVQISDNKATENAIEFIDYEVRTYGGSTDNWGFDDASFLSSPDFQILIGNYTTVEFTNVIRYDLMRARVHYLIPLSPPVEENDSLSSSGGIIKQAALARVEEEDLVAATATLPLQADFTNTEFGDSTVSAAKVRIVAVSTTESSDTFNSTTVIKIRSANSLTELNDTVSFVTNVDLVAQVPEQFEENDTFDSTSKTIVEVNTVITEEGDTASIIGISNRRGLVASTEVSDSVGASSKLELKATYSVAEFNDSTISAAKITLSALATHEISDTFTATSELSTKALLVQSETSDELEARANALSGAGLFIEEADDAFISTAKLSTHGSSSLFDDPDTTISLARVTIAASLAAETSDTSTSVAKISLKAAVSRNESSDTLEAPAILQDVYRASVAITEEADTLSSPTNIKIIAQSARTEIADAVLAQGDLIARGALISTEGNDTFSATSFTRISGEFAGFENDDLTASADITISLDATLEESNDVSSFVGTIDLVSAVFYTEQSDTLLMSSSYTVFANSNIRDDDDTLLFSTHNHLKASTSIAEDDDAPLFEATLPLTGVFFCLEDNDDRVVIAHNPLESSVTITEQADILLGRFDYGTAEADLTVTEQPDTFDSTSRIKIKAVHTKIEGSDTVSSRIERRLIANATIQETNDSVLAQAQQHIKSTFIKAEANDQTNSSGKLRIVSSISKNEADDGLTSNTRALVKAVLVQLEESDTFLSTSKLIAKATAITTADDDTVTSAATLGLRAVIEISEDNDTNGSDGTIDIEALVDFVEESDSLAAQCFILGGEPEKDDIVRAYAVIKKIKEAVGGPFNDDDQDGSIHLVWANETYGAAHINTRRLRKSINTIAIHAHDFEGSVLIEGTISDNPSEDDWFIISEEVFERPEASETKYENRMVNARGRIRQMRAHVEVVRGDIDRVLVL